LFIFVFYELVENKSLGIVASGGHIVLASGDKDNDG
jgi:hypothetical protein